MAQTSNANESIQTACGSTLGTNADRKQQKDCAGNALNGNSFSQLEGLRLA
jgi:hypothetical protein